MKERIALLRQHEPDCYGACLYLLQSEQMACEAAQHALCALARSDAFFTADAKTRSVLLRKQAMQSSLQIKKQTLHSAMA
ncbi:hypothetical protein [Paenibacillus konkukensis]|nr:hypothetical protein [Paenibacillus konkukensis]